MRRPAVRFRSAPPSRWVAEPILLRPPGLSLMLAAFVPFAGPCGARTRPLDGFARRAAHLLALRAAASPAQLHHPSDGPKRFPQIPRLEERPALRLRSGRSSLKTVRRTVLSAKTCGFGGPLLTH